MNNKALTLSVIIAILAIFFVQSYVTSVEEEAKKRFGTEINVVVAKRDIKEMETINETLLELKTLPKKFVEPGTVSLEKKDPDEKETARTLKMLVGTVSVVPIKKGEQLSFNKITDPSIRTGLSTQVAPGKRAIAIPVDEFSGVSKLIKPGDRVDVVAVIDAGGGKDSKIVKTLLQDIVILSVGRLVTNNIARIIEADNYTGKDKMRSLAEDFSFGSVTLEVEPAQAQAVALVMSNGDSRFMLSLRNNDDADRTNVPAMMMADILGADFTRAKQASGKK